jgi:hypothetical protein
MKVESVRTTLDFSSGTIDADLIQLTYLQRGSITTSSCQLLRKSELPLTQKGNKRMEHVEL